MNYASFGNAIPLDENAFTHLYTCRKRREQSVFTSCSNNTLNEWKNNSSAARENVSYFAYFIPRE